MTIKVRVIPQARKIKVQSLPEGLKVYVNSPATEGRANKELIEVIARYYKVKKRNIVIIRGQKQKNKVIQISEVARRKGLCSD